MMPGLGRHPALRLTAAAIAIMAVARIDPASAQDRHDLAASSAAVCAVGPIGITVGDMDRSVRFFCDVLAFEKTSDRELAGHQLDAMAGLSDAKARVAELKLGDERLTLTEFREPGGRPMPADSRANDLWFQHVAIIVRDMDQAYGVLRKHKVEHASAGPQELPAWNKNAGGIRAFYFRDPDGHFLEIVQFPPEKGDPKWHRQTDKLFLGIDHTAIVVRDTDASLGFYRDKLGLKVAGESENYGPEQERLNGVFAARLRITTLRAESGPGIELLEYIHPRDGRPRPAEAQSNDLLHWQIGLIVGGVNDGDPNRDGRGEFAPDRLSDPDGHWVVLTRSPKE
jgi:catechol 2,3-dioxygenase-like lactoylglutathione lyase family enzyme